VLTGTRKRGIPVKFTGEKRAGAQKRHLAKRVHFRARLVIDTVALERLHEAAS
jgi:hypothetical protein